MTGTWQTLVYGSRCSGNDSLHSKLVDTGISHSPQQHLFLDNVLKKRNTNDKNVRIFSSISYAGPCTAVNSAFKLTTHLQSDSPENRPSLRFHFNIHWSCRRVTWTRKKQTLIIAFQISATHETCSMLSGRRLSYSMLIYNYKLKKLRHFFKTLSGMFQSGRRGEGGGGLAGRLALPTVWWQVFCQSVLNKSVKT